MPIAIALVASVSATPGSGGGATAAIDTTGADLIVMSAASFSAGFTVSDSKGNTYTALTLRGGSFRQQLFYCLAPSVGASHTFTVTSTYPPIFVYAFSGVSSYQTEGGATAASGTSLASGNITPAADGALIVTGLGASGTGTQTDTVTPTGFVTPTTKQHTGGTNVAGAASYYIQPTAATINPTWSWTGGSRTDIVVGTAVFLAGAPVITTRVTQDMIEVLSAAGPPEGRITQYAIELLTSVAAAPVTAVETVSSFVWDPL